MNDDEMIRAFHAEREANPDLMPYIGPQDTLDRFLAGEIVTSDGMLTDQSPFVARNLDPRQHRRLKWMLDRGRTSLPRRCVIGIVMDMTVYLIIAALTLLGGGLLLREHIAEKRGE